MSTRGLIALRDPREHARRRRPWNRAFTPTALKGYTPIILRRTSQLTDALAKHVGEVDLAQWFSYLSCVLFCWMERRRSDNPVIVMIS